MLDQHGHEIRRLRVLNGWSSLYLPRALRPPIIRNPLPWHRTTYLVEDCLEVGASIEVGTSVDEALHEQGGLMLQGGRGVCVCEEEGERRVRSRSIATPFQRALLRRCRDLPPRG